MNDIITYGISCIGNVRENHEDNLFVPLSKYIDLECQKRIKTKCDLIEYEYKGNNGIFAVCDGMGGHNAGEVASRIAVEEIQKKYNELLHRTKSDLINFIKGINETICNASDKDINLSNMGTTFSGVIMNENNAYYLHVGDSRIYRYSKGELVQLTKDHTEGNRLVALGVIKIEDLPKFPNRKLLYKYLGRKVDLIADCDAIDYSVGDKIVISSDGLSDTLSDVEILNVLLDDDQPRNICNELIKRCLEKGSKCNDNVTIICIDIK